MATFFVYTTALLIFLVNFNVLKIDSNTPIGIETIVICLLLLAIFGVLNDILKELKRDK